MKIGQISFFEMTTPAEHPYGSTEKGSKYQGQRGPTPSRYYQNFRDGEVSAADGRVRCSWAGDDPLMVAYHDDEWGVPQHDDVRLFEKLTPRRRAGRALVADDPATSARATAPASPASSPAKVARFTDARRSRSSCSTRGIVRNRAKITSVDRQRQGGAPARARAREGRRRRLRRLPLVVRRRASRS